MYRCNSCKNIIVPRSSAKLILQDGALMEFDTPIKISHILRNDHSSFICDSDDMEFNNIVSALTGEYELRLGHLYFSLPLSWLKHPLRPADMAGLAVKASSVFMTTARGGGLVHCGCRSGFNDYKSSRKVKKAKGDGWSRKFYKSSISLSVIPE